MCFSRRRRRAVRDAGQRLDKCHEQGACEYEQQYEVAEWPHWKVEELPSMGTRPITQANYPGAARCRRGLLPVKQPHRALLCPIWGKGQHFSQGIGRFNRILPRGGSWRVLRAFFVLSQPALIPRRLNGDMPRPTRVEAGRRRAQIAKRTVTVAATTGFVVALALVRQGHPASARASAGSDRSSQSRTSPSSARRRGFDFDGGSIEAPSGGVAPVATSTS